MNQATSDPEIRAAVVACLLKKRKPGDNPVSVDVLIAEFAKLAKEHGMQHDTGNGLVNAWNDNRYEPPTLLPNWHTRIWSIVWDMIVEGTVRPGIENSDQCQLPHLYVTSFGRDALSNPGTPYDPEGYLKRLSERVPVDPVIIDYLAESAKTLRNNCLLSSSITLGCASEHAMLLLVEKTEDCLKVAEKPSFKKNVVDQRQSKQKNEEYRKWFSSYLKPLVKVKGGDWLSQFDNALSHLFSHFRMIRNEAGHPALGARISREEAHARLLVFPDYLRLMYDLMEWLDQNKPV